MKRLKALTLVAVLGLPVSALAAANNTVVQNLQVTGLTPGNCMQASTAGLVTAVGSACGTVTAVTGSGNISSSGGTTPNVTITNAPTFSGAVTTSSNGLGAFTATNGGIRTLSSSNAGNTTVFGNYVGGTGGNFPIAFAYTNTNTKNTAIGSASANSIAGISGTCLDIGQYAGTSLDTNLVTIDCSGNVGLAAGLFSTGVTDSGLTSGKCVQAGASGLLANAAGGSCPTTRSNTTLLGGTHVETVPSTSVAGVSTGTFTFGAAYAAAPVCTVSTVASGTSITPAFNVTSTSTTQLVVTNTNALSQNYSAICVGF